MGKPKRYNVYDSEVEASRRVVKGYGEARSRHAMGTGFDAMALSPATFTKKGVQAGIGTGTGTFCSASLSADQTTNITATDHIEFDQLDEDGGITLETGVGQADGIFELSAGKKYYLSALLRPEFSGATGSLVVAWYDITNTAEIGRRAIYNAQTHAGHNADQPETAATYTPDVNITVEVRIISVTALTTLATEYSLVNIFEIALGGSGGGSSGGGGGSITYPITPTIIDYGNVGGGTTDLDLSLTTGHVHKMTLTADETLTFSNPPASGTQQEFEIEFVQDGTGGWAVTWPASVAETVTISAVASSTTIVTVRVNDGGTIYHAIPALRGSISLTGSASFANTALSNLVSPTLTTDINMNSYDFTNVDRVQFTSSSGAVSSAGTPTILLDSNSDMSLNIGTGKQFQFDFQAVNKWTLDATQFTGANIILSNTITIQNSSSDPSATVGQIVSNGADCKVYSGGEIQNFTDINKAATKELDNLGTTAINASLLFDTDSAYNIGAFGTAANAIYSEEYTIPIGGSFTGTRNQIIADAAGMMFNTPSGDDYTWDFAGSATPPWAMSVLQFTGPAIILSGSMTITDSSSDPAAVAGMFSTNGADCKVYSGGNIINLSNAGESFTWSNDHDANTHNLDNLGVLNQYTTGTLPTAGFINMANAAKIAWEAQPAGTDGTLTYNISESFEFSGDRPIVSVSNGSLGLSGQEWGTVWAQAGVYSSSLTSLGDLTVGSSASDTATFTADVVVNNSIVIGSSGVDTFTVAGGIIEKSTSSTEIGFQVTNESITIGTEGTIQMPRGGAPGTASAADTDFGNKPGCIGVQDTGSGSLILYIRQADGNWAGVLLTRDTLV